MYLHFLELILETKELGPWRSGGVRINPSLFGIRDVLPKKEEKFSSELLFA